MLWFTSSASINKEKKMSEETAVVAKVTKKRVSDHDFVVEYCDSISYEELAFNLDLTRASVASRANKLRKLGVKLPEYDRAKKVVDIAALNALIV